MSGGEGTAEMDSCEPGSMSNVCVYHLMHLKKTEGVQRVSDQRPGNISVTMVQLQFGANAGQFAGWHLGSKNPKWNQFKKQSCLGGKTAMKFHCITKCNTVYLL